MRRARWPILGLAGLGALVVYLLLRAGPAPVPAVFSEDLTMAQAQARARESGRPVLVFATADWCGPCQSFKRTTLADGAVTRWIAENTVPVYLDVDKNREQAGGLSITSIPASIMMHEGRISARLQGAVGRDEYLAWLRSSGAPPTR